MPFNKSYPLKHELHIPEVSNALHWSLTGTQTFFELNTQFFEQVLHTWVSQFQEAQPKSEGLALFEDEKEQLPLKSS
jgi:hypothetical protein